MIRKNLTEDQINQLVTSQVLSLQYYAVPVISMAHPFPIEAHQINPLYLYLTHRYNERKVRHKDNFIYLLTRYQSKTTGEQTEADCRKSVGEHILL